MKGDLPAKVSSRWLCWDSGQGNSLSRGAEPLQGETMRLEEAPEILTDLLGEDPQFPPDVRRAAVKLGIQASLVICRVRHAAPGSKYDLLPGETKG